VSLVLTYDRILDPGAVCHFDLGALCYGIVLAALRRLAAALRRIFVQCGKHEKSGKLQATRRELINSLDLEKPAIAKRWLGDFS
jgi:hypothetical protein